jgi:hypothetical protein
MVDASVTAIATIIPPAGWTPPLVPPSTSQYGSVTVGVVGGDDIKSLWTRDLQPWMGENDVFSIFSTTGEVLICNIMYVLN